jgi:hypothetical protein
MTLISPENDFALMAALFVIAGGAFLAEKTKVGSHLTGAVMAILSCSKPTSGTCCSRQLA